MFKSLLDVKQVDKCVFTNISHRENFRRRVFGGQVLAQALMASMKTVDSGRTPHSMHAYFLRAGEASEPIYYHVEKLRDGGSISSRSIKAIQNGTPIFQALISFHLEESGYMHQATMPQGLPTPEAAEEKAKKNYKIPEHGDDNEASPFKIVPVSHDLFSSTDVHEPEAAFWMKTIAPIPDEHAFHYCALAFASDLGLLASSLLPHPTSLFSNDVVAASIDHAMWFHQHTFNTSEWMLCVLKSPWAGNARGFGQASIFSREGKLIANTAQEGLIRPKYK